VLVNCPTLHILNVSGNRIIMSKKEDPKEENSIIPEIIETGYEVGGSLGSAIIGGLLAGPAGVVIGAASGPILTKLFTKVGSEIKNRILGAREESRIGFTYATGYDKLKTRLESGDELRQDDFFDIDENNRSTAEEILEGVLRSAQSEYQEKKLKYYGNLLANISFDKSVTKDKAYLFLKVAQNLSYKQLCILKFLNRNGQINLNWGYNFNGLAELTNYADLEPSVEDLDKNKLLAILRTSGNTISIMNISKLGVELTNLMNLSEIPEEDISSLSKELSDVDEIIKKNKK
jgi:hypothetical protein